MVEQHEIKTKSPKNVIMNIKAELYLFASVIDSYSHPILFPNSYSILPDFD